MNMNQKTALVLVELDDEQIRRAKSVNGERKRITHGLFCGRHGQLFGTEKQCRRYYDAWKRIFPELFHSAYETTDHTITDYTSIYDLTERLIDASEEPRSEATHQEVSSSEEPAPAFEIPVKQCRYKGSWSNAGCNVPIEAWEEYCHAHRHQGPCNRVGEFGKIGCAVLIVVVVALIIATGQCS